MSNLVFPSRVRGLTYTVVKSQENSAIEQESPNFVSTRILQAQNPRWHWRLEYTVLFDNILNPNPNYSYTDLQIMLGFCQTMYSNYDDFLYVDPDDNFVGPGLITDVWRAYTNYSLGNIIIASGHAQQVVAIAGNYRSGLVLPAFSISGGTVVEGGITWQDIGVVSGTGWPNPFAALQVVNDGATTPTYYSPLQRNLGGQFWEDITDLASGLTVYDNGTITTNYVVSSGGLAIPGTSSGGIYLTWLAQPTGPVTATFNFFFRVRLEEPTTDFEKFVNQMWAMGGEEGSSGKGYLKLQSSGAVITAGSTALTPNPGWTTPPIPIPRGGPPPAPNPGPPPGPPTGGTGTDDMLTWCLIPQPTRSSFHMAGDLYSASVLDTDGIYPTGFPGGVFFWIKGKSGHPWDVETYSGTQISHWITEDGDAVSQAACHAAGFTSCFVDPFAYKRLLTPIPMMPRFFTHGTTITIDTPGPNTFVRTTNCESPGSSGNVNLGDVRCITTGPFTMSWGGSVGTAPTIQNDFHFGGKISSGVFIDRESTFYVQGYGRIAWKYYRLVNGAYVLQQSSINNNLVSGGAPVPVFPCGPGKPWFVGTTPTTHEIDFSWAASSTPGVTYNVYRASISGGPYTRIATGLTSLGYSDFNVVSGQTYFYVIRSFDGSFESPNSAEITATVP